MRLLLLIAFFFVAATCLSQPDTTYRVEMEESGYSYKTNAGTVMSSHGMIKGFRLDAYTVTVLVPCDCPRADFYLCELDEPLITVYSLKHGELIDIPIMPSQCQVVVSMCDKTYLGMITTKEDWDDVKKRKEERRGKKKM